MGRIRVKTVMFNTVFSKQAPPTAQGNCRNKENVAIVTITSNQEYNSSDRRGAIYRARVNDTRLAGLIVNTNNYQLRSKSVDNLTKSVRHSKKRLQQPIGRPKRFFVGVYSLQNHQNNSNSTGFMLS